MGGGAPGGTGPAMSPAPMMGNAAQGMAAVKTAVEALTKALPSLPMGSDLHKAALSSLTTLTKHLDDGGLPQPGGDDQVQQLAAMARAAQQGGQSPLAGMMPGGGGGDGAPPPPGA